MPLFLDSHSLPEGLKVDLADMAEHHAHDVALGEKYGVRYLKYWYDAARGRVFCLVLAPTREAALAVHWEANGVRPDDIFEVQEFAGEVFAAGHAEVGNDLAGMMSTARAERVEGGYRFWGRKMFNSLSPVWTRLGFHAHDNSDPANPLIIHAFLPREADGYRIEATWDTLGMRATRSDDTILEGAFIPDRYIARKIPAMGFDLMLLGLFGYFLPPLWAVYYGLARRAADLAITSVHNKSSVGLTQSMAYHPEVQHLAAEITLELEAMSAHLQRVAEDWSTGVDHGPAWGLKLLALKHHCTESAKNVVDLAMTMSGGTGMYKRNELERLYRIAMCAAAASTQPTRCLLTSSSAR